MGRTKKLTPEEVEKLKEQTDVKKTSEAKIKPVTGFRSILALVK